MQAVQFNFVCTKAKSRSFCTPDSLVMGKGVKTEKDRAKTQMKGTEQPKAVLLNSYPLWIPNFIFPPAKPYKLHPYSSRSWVFVFQHQHLIFSNLALKSLKDVGWSQPNSLHSDKTLWLSPDSGSCSCQAQLIFSIRKSREVLNSQKYWD